VLAADPAPTRTPVSASLADLIGPGDPTAYLWSMHGDGVTQVVHALDGATGRYAGSFDASADQCSWRDAGPATPDGLWITGVKPRAGDPSGTGERGADFCAAFHPTDGGSPRVTIVEIPPPKSPSEQQRFAVGHHLYVVGALLPPEGGEVTGRTTALDRIPADGEPAADIVAFPSLGSIDNRIETRTAALIDQGESAGATVAVTPPKADLVVTKRTDRQTVAVGDRVTFTLAVTNAGPEPAWDARVGDAVLKGGHILVDSLPARCTPFRSADLPPGVTTAFDCPLGVILPGEESACSLLEKGSAKWADRMQSVAMHECRSMWRPRER
jgi:uncharacterized repeat protein (TIGR01451 family)